MDIQQINRLDAEKVYVICKNISGAELAAGVPVYYDVADATNGQDGHAVSGAGTTKKYLFAGIVKDAIADDAHGAVQAYGKATAKILVTGAMAVGDQLDAVASAAYLANFVPVSATSLVPTVANPWNFVTAMSAVASGISTATSEIVFVRAL